ncbi:hypothetical protein SALBM217S_08812 [Streptomyces griseoloalbus]
MDGFLIDMNQLFEDFVTVALSEALKEHGLTARLQDTHHLDTAGLVRIRPDLVVRTRDGRTPVAVVDAKYKVEKGDGRLNADLYQALAYATVLGLREAHLVRGGAAAHALPRGARDGGGRGRARRAAAPAQRRPVPRAGQLLSALRDIAVRLARARTPA